MNVGDHRDDAASELRTVVAFVSTSFNSSLRSRSKDRNILWDRLIPIQSTAAVVRSRALRTASGSGRQLCGSVAVVFGIQGDSGGDQLVDPVEDLCRQREIGGGQL